MTDRNNTIHIHEDDWGMRTIHPMAAWDQMTRDVEISVEQAMANQAESGAGYTGVHVIAEAKHNYASEGLSLETLLSAISNQMPRVTHFYSTASAGFYPDAKRDPWGSYEEDALCFGYDAECYLKIDVKDGAITDIWYEARTADKTRLTTLLSVLQQIDMLCPSFVADYCFDVTGKVSDTDFMSGYQASLLERNTEIANMTDEDVDAFLGKD